MDKAQKLLMKLLIAAIVVNVFIAAWVPMHDDAHYFSDNARDMLLIHEILTEKPITLIGPRSGISGVFHGPLWLYMNLPAFYLGDGDVGAVAWFWFLLYVANIAIVYKVAKKLFNKTAGILAGLFFAYTFYSTGWSQFNANGVLLMTPLLLYYILEYIQHESIVHAIGIYLIIGVIIQFQIAFGFPVLILTTLLLAYNVIKKKKWKHSLAPIALIIPTATHILFDLRHNFIQLRSLLSYSSDSGKALVPHTMSRLGFAIRELSQWLPQQSDLASIFLIILLIYGMVKIQNVQLKRAISIYVYFYIGFWLITAAYTGTMWPYYYWGFMPLLFIVIGGIISQLSKKAQIAIFSVILIAQILFTFQWYIYEKDYVLEDRPISWKFHKNAVEKIFNETSDDFGYYVFSDDLYGYRPKYAFEYWNNERGKEQAHLNDKYPRTYTYMMPTDSVDLTWEGWIENNARITRKPDSTEHYSNGVAVYRFDLSDEEQSVESDPYLIDSLIFR